VAWRGVHVVVVFVYLQCLDGELGFRVAAASAASFSIWKTGNMRFVFVFVFVFVVHLRKFARYML